MEKNIAVIYGDCASPEIVTQALRVLDAVAEKFGHTFTYTKVLMGGEAIDAYGDPLPQSELDKCLQSDSVLLGAIGGPKWEGLPGDKRAEKGLLRLRAGMGLYSNNRPAKIWPQLADASPLKPAIVEKGIDFIVVRELIGGVYFGEHRTYEENGEKVAVDTMPYSEHEIERIGRIGFETARKRQKKLTCVDKANVLDTSRLWRHADLQGSRPVRRDCHGEHVRRHPVRRGQRDHRQHRHGALLQPGGRHPGAVRAHPRLCPGHRRTGYHQPHRLHPVRGHDAAVQLRYGGGGRLHRSCGESSAERRHPHRRHLAARM